MQYTIEEQEQVCKTFVREMDAAANTYGLSISEFQDDSVEWGVAVGSLGGEPICEIFPMDENGDWKVCVKDSDSFYTNDIDAFVINLETVANLHKSYTTLFDFSNLRFVASMDEVGIWIDQKIMITPIGKMFHVDLFNLKVRLTKKGLGHFVLGYYAKNYKKQAA